jgi:formate dehydrogenase subunit gamma
MTTKVERFDEPAPTVAAGYGRTVVYDDELLRHSLYTRLLHWTVAIFFILSLLTGLAIYTPWLFAWISPAFGGGARTRALHPWFSIAFVVFFALQFVNWLAPMAWTKTDRLWLRNMKAYVTNTEAVEPEYVAFFNAGQKMYFWVIVVSSVVFVVTGIPMWFPEVFGRIAVAISYVLHDVAMLVMLVGFIVHVYEGTAAQQGTLHSMLRGTVSKRWAWTHHPAWYREVSGRDPRADYERARRAAEERRQAPLQREPPNADRPA